MVEGSSPPRESSCRPPQLRMVCSGPSPDCPQEEECVPPLPGASQPEKQPSLLPSEHQPPSLEPCGSKVGGWRALALPLPTSPGPHRPSSLGGSWRHTQLLCL